MTWIHPALWWPTWRRPTSLPPDEAGAGDAAAASRGGAPRGGAGGAEGGEGDAAERAAAQRPWDGWGASGKVTWRNVDWDRWWSSIDLTSLFKNGEELRQRFIIAGFK